MQVEDAERILDELEEIARSDITNRRFFEQIVASLQSLVDAQSASILTRLPQAGWICVTNAGLSNKSLLPSFSERVDAHADSRVIESHSQSGSWLAHAIQAANWDGGAILVAFDRDLPPAAMSGVSAVVGAFCEILAIRHASRVELLFAKNHVAIQQLNQALAASESTAQSAVILVNQLLPLLSAARVSIFASPNALAIPNVLAISGTELIDRSSLAVRSLQALARQAASTNDPLLRQSNPHIQKSNLHKTREDGTFEDVLVLKWTSNHRLTSDGIAWLVVEWENTQEMLDAMYAVMHIVPWLATTWQLQNRWLRVPKIWRTGWLAPRGKRFPYLSSKATRWLVIVLVTMVLGWILMRPTTMKIEAEAILEPVVNRTIFATTDGYLHRLHVEDGQTVKSGQPLAELRSPTLDLQIEEVVGQIQAIAEKRNGLRIANAQATETTDEASASQTRIASEILLLDTQEKHARGKLEFLHRERSKLTLVSPIAGTVVSRRLKQELESRPLRRGDSLFSVMDVRGQWQLNIQVADRDTGYLVRHYGQQTGTIEFILDSNPSERFEGQVFEVGRVIENSLGTGGHLQVLASPPAQVAAAAHLGATARVTFQCGQTPLWFVWCRPAVEAIQKRTWLFTW